MSGIESVSGKRGRRDSREASSLAVVSESRTALFYQLPFVLMPPLADVDGDVDKLAPEKTSSPG